MRDAPPFRDSDEVWFAYMRVLANRRTARQRRTAAPPFFERVSVELDRLYRQRRIDPLHARILRIWGDRQTAPNPAFPSERCDWRIWREALDRLDWPLRKHGLIGPVAQQAA